uniref:Uncharacterized protein n=1 Tax=Trichobilharzia regenti TaxID=157069 RepID=A0AA85ITH2_TRIRE|nr:unnamed protein product [Trichobilharzia regenti]
MGFDTVVFGFLIVFSVTLLPVVNCNDMLNIIFDLRTYFVNVWYNVFSRFADTIHCLLGKLPPSLGGNNKICLD